MNVAVLMGGYSMEEEVSYKSGDTVIKCLKSDKYTPYPVHITKQKWFCPIQGKECLIDKNDFSIEKDGQKIRFDVAFNAIHGTPGEDGFLQGYFSFLDVPITGCSMYSSALTFNKRDTLSVLRQFGIKCADSVSLNKGDNIDVLKIVEKVGLPCFVKANRSGSSFGVYKVYEKEQIEKAIEKAFCVDNQIIIERCLVGTEVSVGVITFKKEVVVLPITEIVSGNDFFDYEAKYLGKSQEITPARLSKEMTKKIEELSKKIYKLLGMKGFSRSEFIIVGDEPYFLEMNTTPGLTQTSILPKQASAAGISLRELFENAIEESLNK